MKDIGLITEYEDILLGKRAAFSTLRVRKEMSEDQAADLLHYVFYDLLGWSGPMTCERISIPLLHMLKLESIAKKVAFPPELDRQKDLAYLAHVAFPKSVPSPKREWILAVYHRVLSGELEKYPKNFFLAQESDLYLAVCMQDALNHLPVSRTADLYDYFADEEKGWSFLKKACLYTPAHNFYDYPIDVLHASLEPDQRSELDYHYGRFCCDMKRQKRKRRYRACASESTTGT